MRPRITLFVAVRLASESGRRSFRPIRGPILAMALCLLPLIVVLAVSNGMIEGITRRYLETASYHLQLFPRADLVEAAVAAAAARVRGVRQVRLVVPERQGVAVAATEEARGGVVIRAVPSWFWEDDAELRRYLRLQAGSFDLSAGDTAVLGSELARRLGVGVGDEIRLLTARSLAGGRLLPRVSRFRVAGIVSAGYQELDKLWVFIDYDRGNRILGRDSSRLILGVKVDDPFGSPERNIIDIGSAAGEGFVTKGWFDLERGQYMSFATTRFLLVFIMALILCVAAVNISSSLVMLQFEKREQIAVLKALGLDSSSLVAAFVLIGLLVGIIGAFGGIAVGLAVAVSINQLIAGLEATLTGIAGIAHLLFPALAASPGDIRILDPRFYLEEIPARLSPVELAGAACFAIGLSVAGSLVAALRAGRLKPLDIIRRH